MKIRNFEEKDRQALKALWEACALTKPCNDPDKDIDRKCQFQPDLFFVGLADSRLIASVMAGYDGHRGSVFYLAVHPDYQGNGYGKQLMSHIEVVLEALGCPKLNLVVRSSNESVRSFYNKLAYTPDDVVSLGKRLIPDA